MSQDWPNEKTLYLIELYRMQELLWNTKHTNHYNKSARFNAWKEIAKDMAINVDECQKKMNSVLSSLRRERAKIRKGRANGKGVYQSSWFAFKNLQFLLNKEERLRNDSALDNTQGKYVDQLIQEMDTSLKTNQTSINNILQDYTLPPFSQSVLPSKKQKLYNDRRESKVITRTTRDECQYFGNFVAAKLFNYTPHTRNAVQHEISNILFSADHGYFEPEASKHSSHSHNSTPVVTYTSEMEVNNHSNELSPISSPSSSEDLETENLI